MGRANHHIRCPSIRSAYTLTREPILSASLGLEFASIIVGDAAIVRLEGRWWHLLLISGPCCVHRRSRCRHATRGGVRPPIGPAMLEFFPPNSMFLIAAATGGGSSDRNLTSSTDAPPDRDGALFPDDAPASTSSFWDGSMMSTMVGGPLLRVFLPCSRSRCSLVPVAWLHDRPAPTNSIQAWSRDSVPPLRNDT